MAKITKNPVMYHDGETWQIIFKVYDSKRVKLLDYCREQVHASWTIEEVEQWVNEKCAAHNLDGADIQRWN